MALSERQARSERIRVQFIIAEIETAWAVARSAEILYGCDSKNADKLAGKACEAYTQALSHFKGITAGKELRESLSEKLNQIRELLDTLPFRKPKGKSHRFKVYGGS